MIYIQETIILIFCFQKIFSYLPLSFSIEQYFKKYYNLNSMIVLKLKKKIHLSAWSTSEIGLQRLLDHQMLTMEIIIR